MSSSNPHTKKRKRAASHSEAQVSLQVASFDVPESSAPGPVLISTPALDPPSSTPFKVYGKRRKTDGLEPGKLMVAGETPAVEYSSSFNQEGNSPGCRYYVAVHDRSTRTTKLFTPSIAGTSIPTPVHFLKHSVKALKALPSPPPSVLPYLDARNALGETFGTKKAKAQIRLRERQKVDLDAVKGVVSHIVDAIDKGAEGLTTKEEAQEIANASRPIPPFSTTATNPADIYQLHDIIPEVEWKALSASIAPLLALGHGSRPKDRQAVFPWKHSSWINGHIGQIVQAGDKTGIEGKQGKKNLRILFYISSMMLFRNTLQRVGIEGIDKNVAQERMSAIPNVVMDGLLSRFTETSRNSTKHIFTSIMETKLHTYMFALCLRVDNFASDSTAIAKDLSLAVTSVNQLFKALGCKITVLADRDRTRLGLPDSTKETKRAILTAPVTFPKPKVGKKKK